MTASKGDFSSTKEGIYVSTKDGGSSKKGGSPSKSPSSGVHKVGNTSSSSHTHSYTYPPFSSFIDNYFNTQTFFPFSLPPPPPPPPLEHTPFDASHNTPFDASHSLPGNPPASPSKSPKTRTSRNSSRWTFRMVPSTVTTSPNHYPRPTSWW